MHVSKLGDTYAVVLSEETLKRLGLKEGDEVEVRPAPAPSAVSSEERIEALHALRKYRGSLPAGYKFNREELYERGPDVED